VSVTAILIFLSGPPVRADGENGAEVVNLDEIVVTGTKTEHTLENVPVETVVLTKKDIEAVNAENIMDVLGTIPGIHTANHEDVFGTYTWNARMGGLPFDSGYALVLIDGQRVMGCGASGGMGDYGIGLNQVPVSMIERIEVVKGPGSALYGSDAVTGVINVITKKIPAKPTGSAGMSYGRYDVKRKNADGSEEHANGSRVMNQAYASYGDRITDRLGYLMYYSYEGSDDLAQDPVTDERHSFMGKIDGSLNDQVDLSLKYEAGEYDKTASRDENSRGLTAKAGIRLNRNHRFDVSAYTYVWNFIHGAPGSSSGYKVGDVGYDHGEVQYTFDLENRNTLSAGVEVLRQDIDYTILNSNGSLVVVDENVDVNSLYLQDEYKAADWVTLVAGARYDDHSTFGDEVNPKFSLMLKPLKDTTVRASAGRSFKSPTIRQLYYSTPYRHSTYYAQSNPDLKPEKAVGYSASVEQGFFENRVVTSVGYSRNDVTDMVITVDTGTLYDGLPLMTYRNVNKAHTQSGELMVRAIVSKWFGFSLSYTYMDTENEETGAELTYVPKHDVSFVPSFALFGGRLNFSATLSYTGKQYINEDNTKKIDAGTTLDAKVKYALSPSASLSFEADNVFDSAKGVAGSWQVGRSYMAKLDLVF
jgi:outer membrane receptor for ferrienterochelin and colicins